MKEARKLPHVKKVNPTGGGKPLPPLQKEWQKILVEIIQENLATQGLEGGIESGVNQEQIDVALGMEQDCNGSFEEEEEEQEEQEC